MAETFDQQLARLRSLAAIELDDDPMDPIGVADQAALAELLRRWDAIHAPKVPRPWTADEMRVAECDARRILSQYPPTIDGASQATSSAEWRQHPVLQGKAAIMNTMNEKAVEFCALVDLVTAPASFPAYIAIDPR
jgi:hypothetical protein